MEFVLSLLDAVFRPMKDFFARTYGYVFSCGAYMSALDHEMVELRCKRDDVRRMVAAAERRGMEPTMQVQWWLSSVESLDAQSRAAAAAYSEAFAASAPGEVPTVSVRYALSKHADELTAAARSYNERGAFDKVADEQVQVKFEEVPSVPVIGMDPVFEELRRCLDDAAAEAAGIIGIHGMAGVGKTALLNKFNNECLVGSPDISVAIYIEVGKEIDLDRIQKIIGDRLSLSWEHKTPKERAVMLYKVLSKMNFVLLLDDLWEPINLQMLGIPVAKPKSKSKIFLTTRIEDVCDRMDVGKKIRIECLSQEHAFELFQEKVGRHLSQSAPLIRRLAEELAGKCGGLPLALTTVGRAMASKRTAKEWKHAITVMKIAPWQLLGMETDLLSHLKKSYDSLPNDKLRVCLLYCSLFAEDFPIYKEWVIGYCIGEGFIDDIYTEVDEIYNKGHDILGDLKTASLLEWGGNDEHIRMHPMVRAMALWIASEFGTKETKWLVRSGFALKEAPGAEKWAAAERVSLMKNDIVDLYESPNCPELKTLLLQSNPSLEKICDGFFQSMSVLRVLDLSHTSLTELPTSIGALTMLQYLDLYNTNIRALPKELASLMNLRFLLLSTMPLEIIPDGVLSCLKLLQVLFMDYSFSGWKVGNGGSGLDFAELETLRRLKAFDVTIQTTEALERLCQSNRLARVTRQMLIKQCNQLRSIEFPSSMWRKMTGVKQIWVADCTEVEEVVISADAAEEESPAMLPSLEKIILQGLIRAKIVYRSGCLNQITSLCIWICIGLTQLITDESEEDEVEEGNGDDEVKVINAFPSLKELYLHGLPRLAQLSGERRLLAFPALKRLKILECNSLKKLRLEAPRLEEINCSLEWWGGLEWDDNDDDGETRAKLSKLLSPAR